MTFKERKKNAGNSCRSLTCDLFVTAITKLFSLLIILVLYQGDKEKISELLVIKETDQFRMTICTMSFFKSLWCDLGTSIYFYFLEQLILILAWKNGDVIIQRNWIQQYFHIINSLKVQMNGDNVRLFQIVWTN